MYLTCSKQEGSCGSASGPTLLALLRLREEELGRRLKRVAWHQHQLLELQQLLDVLSQEDKAQI